LPVSEKLERKSETRNKENKQTKQSEKIVFDTNIKNKTKEGKLSNQSEPKANGEPPKTSQEQEFESAPTMKISELEGNKNLRKTLEEKSKKYSHLPVYDKEEEKRKAMERQAKMSAIFSDMDKNLESVTDLTSSHMAKKGITMKSSATPFDDPKEDSEPQSEIHTIRYNKGILNPRNSASQTQGISAEKDRTSIVSVSPKLLASDSSEKLTTKENNVELVKTTETFENNIKVSETAINSSNQIGIQATKSPLETSQPVYSLPPYKRNIVNPQLPVKKLSEQSEGATGATYESLGQTFRELTEKMQNVTEDIKSEPEIPFMDDGDNEDYRQAVRNSAVSEGRKSSGVLNQTSSKEHLRSSSWLYLPMT